MVQNSKKKLGSGRHLSALKRERQNDKRNLRNKNDRSRLRTAIKATRANPSKETLLTATKLLDKAASKNLYPHGRASRLISRLSKFVAKSVSA